MSIEAFLPGSVPIVAIYDQNYMQLFLNAQPLEGTVKPGSKLMEHPIEIGAAIADHIIFTPIEIEIPLLLRAGTFRETYEDILQTFNKALVLIVQTKASTYTNMVILEPPHEEKPDNYDVIILTLKLKQARFVQSVSQAIVPRNPKNGSTQRRGNVQPGTPTPEQKEKTSIIVRPFL